jgi:two-component system chemotaxis response regulator CheB
VPILVAQHIADGFVPGLVSWLNSGCEIKVVAGEEGVRPSAGTAYFASTGSNMVMDGSVLKFQAPARGQLYIPSADTLFESVATCYGKRSIGVLLTGMGADGAIGLKRMNERGAATIAQDEATSTVFGMPKAAIDMGAADVVLAVNDIAAGIEALLG